MSSEDYSITTKPEIMVGKVIRCIVGDLNPKGQVLIDESASIASDLYLTRKSKRTYSRGEVADFWVLFVSSDHSFCLLTDSDHGFLPISDRMRPRYAKSLRVAVEVIGEGNDPPADDAQWLADLKGMYSRSYKKNQPDWYSVWALLGSPALPACRLLSETLGELGRAIRSNDQVLLEEFRVEMPSQFVAEWRNALETLENDAPRIPNQSRQARKATGEISSKTISISYDSKKLERANRLHSEALRALIRCLAEEGFMPHEHDLIDLFCQLKSGPAIFEVKSLSGDNEESQIRGAFSQLSYYGFLASKQHDKYSGASKWLVLSRKPLRTDLLDWMASESVNVIWLDGTEFSGNDLPWLIPSRRKL